MHTPVMLQEVIHYLQPKEGMTFVDGTLGMGGHAQAVLKEIGLKGHLIGLDKDEAALKIAKENLKDFSEQCSLIHTDFRNIDDALKGINIDSVDGILLDLGMSSFQMDDAQRGFSIKGEGPLDMRMDQTNPISAFDLVNTLSEREISKILKDFGEERWHYAIARRIVRERTCKPIETTEELSLIVLKSMPRKRKREKIHPATRTFQAFRIAVNRELESIEDALDKCLSLLNPGGRLGVIAFHSLEDRIVKHRFRHWAKEQNVELLMKKPLRPTEEEIHNNPRARSARFRVIQRTL